MPEESAVFDALVSEFYPIWCRFRPVATTSACVGCCQGRFPFASEDEFGALQSWLEKLLLGLEELDYSALDDNRKIDLELIFGTAKLEYHDLLEHDWRHRDPVRFNPLLALLPYLESQAEDFQEALEVLLVDIPEKLRLARGHLKTLPELISPTVASFALVQARVSHECLKHLNAARQDDGTNLDNRLVEAMQALDRYARFLNDLIEQGVGQSAKGCGSVHYQRLLTYRQFSKVPLDKLHALAEAEYRSAYETFLDASDGRSPKDVAAGLSNNKSLNGDDAVSFCLEENGRLRSVIESAGLFSLPENALTVKLRDKCSIRSAGYVPGAIWLTDKKTTGTDVQNNCVEYGWTGQHLRKSANKSETQCLPRQLHASVSQEKAWGLYIRSYLLKTGYFDEASAQYQLLHRLIATKLALLDLDLQVNELSEDAALDQLAELGIGEAEAKRLLATVIRKPADALFAVVGYRMFEILPSVIDAPLSQKELHDKLLAEGMLPAPLLIRSAFGQTVLETIEERLFE